MTLPIERMRSLRWGLELLKVLPADRTLPAAIRLRAEAIVQCYPTPAELECLLSEDASGLSDDYRKALDDAADLFQDIRLGESGSTSTRHQLVYVLRHFPRHGTSPLRTEKNVPGRLLGWIEPEGPAKP